MLGFRSTSCMHVIRNHRQQGRVMYLDIKNTGGISTVADDRAQHKCGADGDQLKVMLFAGIPCFPLCRHLHQRQFTMPPADWVNIARNQTLLCRPSLAQMSGSWLQDGV